MESSLAKQFSTRWFITGATGFIGRELVKALLTQNRNKIQISVLVRPGKSVSAKDRLISALSPILEVSEINRIRVYSGDVSLTKFGLDEQSWQEISHSTHLAHLAANTSFSATITNARNSNLQGTYHMADLANHCKLNATLRRWSHCSTAYVAGNRTDLIYPGDLIHGSRFRNCYEQSKNESEHFLQPFLEHYPLTIFRPSIVVGHSKSGKAGNFNTVYWAIRSYLKGQTKFYARPDTPLDLVPVDYVVDAMLKLGEFPQSQGTTLHLAGGKRTTVTLSEFANKVSNYLNSPKPKILSPVRFKLLQCVSAFSMLPERDKRLIEQAGDYLPYFCQNPSFDVRSTESMLRNSGIVVPALDQYLPNILDYCLSQPWGRRSKMPGTGYKLQQVANG